MVEEDFYSKLKLSFWKQPRGKLSCFLDAIFLQIKDFHLNCKNNKIISEFNKQGDVVKATIAVWIRLYLASCSPLAQFPIIISMLFSIDI